MAGRNTPAPHQRCFPSAGNDIYLTVRRPGRRCRGPCAADTHNGHAGRRWDGRAVAPCSCGTVRTRLRMRAATPVGLSETRAGCRTHTPRRRRRRRRRRPAFPHERVRGMVACHGCDPVRASLHTADTAVPVVVPGTRTEDVAAAGTSPRANVINSVEAQPARTWSNASASRWSMVRL